MFTVKIKNKRYRILDDIDEEEIYSSLQSMINDGNEAGAKLLIEMEYKDIVLKCEDKIRYQVFETEHNELQTMITYTLLDNHSDALRSYEFLYYKGFDMDMARAMSFYQVITNTALRGYNPTFKYVDCPNYEEIFIKKCNAHI